MKNNSYVGRKIKADISQKEDGSFIIDAIIEKVSENVITVREFNTENLWDLKPKSLSL